MKRLGLITIGQAPRTDLTPDIAPLLAGIEIIERGALDHLSNEEIAGLVVADGDEILTSRLRDGSSAVFGREHVLPQIQAAITELENHPEHPVDAILLACAGEFPSFEHKTLFLTPDAIMSGVLTALSRELDTVGLICPLPEQVGFIVESMSSIGAKVIGEAANPYTEGIEQSVAAAQRLMNRGAQLLVGFCMGYTEEMRTAVSRATGLPVVLVRSVSARLAAEILQPAA